MTTTGWLTPALILGAIALTWSITTWWIRRTEEIAEKKKRAVLAVTLSSEGILESYPIGGHRDPRAPSMFWIYVENTGDAKAEHVEVTFELPAWVHPGTPRTHGFPRHNDDGTTDWVTMERDASEDVKFKTCGTRSGGNHAAVVVLPRPIYPGQKQQIGLVVVDAPDGKHRFDWSIESSAGRFESDIATAVYIRNNGTAVGHDDIPWSELRDPAGRKCAKCDVDRNAGPSLGGIPGGGPKA